jgi:molybdopterin/thiamine biosynthesis adenylyltransferase
MPKNKKGFRRIEIQKPEVITTVDTSYLRAATVRTREWQRCQIILVGLGGGGSHLAQHIGRTMRAIYRLHKGVHLTLCDPDIVEEKNVEAGQNFCDAEIGVPKAAALARRYGQAWGINCSYVVGEFDESLIIGCDITVLVGGVDNARARQKLHDVLESNQGSALQFWYLDCSNGSGKTGHVGRVLLGNAHSFEDLRGAFPDSQTCLALPSPALQFRDLLTPRPEEFDDSNLSCAEMAIRGQAALHVGARVAIEGATTLTQLLVTRDLKCFATELSTAARSMRSTYATPDEVARVIGKPVSYVMGQPPAVSPVAANVTERAGATAI